MPVPYPDAVAATVQAQTAHLASVRRSHVGYDAAHDDILDGLAVRASHRRDLLSEESAPLVYIRFISAGRASKFQFPGHL